MKLFIALLLLSSSVYAEQTRTLDGTMYHVYCGSEAESQMVRRDRAHDYSESRRKRMDRLHSKLALF